MISCVYPSARSRSDTTAAVRMAMFTMSMRVFNQMTARLLSQHTKKNLWPFFRSRPSSSSSSSSSLLLSVMTFREDLLLGDVVAFVRDEDNGDEDEVFLEDLEEPGFLGEEEVFLGDAKFLGGAALVSSIWALPLRSGCFLLCVAFSFNDFNMMIIYWVRDLRMSSLFAS